MALGPKHAAWEHEVQGSGIPHIFRSEVAKEAAPNGARVPRLALGPSTNTLAIHSWPCGLPAAPFGPFAGLQSTYGA